MRLVSIRDIPMYPDLGRSGSQQNPDLSRFIQIWSVFSAGDEQLMAMPEVYSAHYYFSICFYGFLGTRLSHILLTQAIAQPVI
jgi:hypothetical protein